MFVQKNRRIIIALKDCFQMIKLTDQHGQKHTLDAVEGWRVMEIIREHGFIQGICDGICECATCHVYVDKPWISKLYPAHDEELELLDVLPDSEENSRLCCQIIYDENLHGLSLTIADVA